uniref:CCHC-type domain-containing protein n=1 Tax=Gopherus agassizii TaxID=38772 RepID=A0A452GK30_9SAUR
MSTRTKMEAEDQLKEAEHRRQLEIKQKEMEIKEKEESLKLAAFQREQAAQEAAHKRKLEEEEVAHRREMEKQQKENEEKEKQRKHELELAKAGLHVPANPNNPAPIIAPQHRKFPTYKAGDDTEAFLENFERACLGYSIPEDQYMVELRPHLSGPLAEVAAEMPKPQMNDYKLFQTKARYRMGITPDHARRRFRTQKWKPEVSFPKHAYYIAKNYEAWLTGNNIQTLEELNLLIQMEQFLDGVPEDITRYIQDRNPKDIAEAGEIGAKWMELAESKKATVKGNDYPRGHTDHKPYNRGQPKTLHTTQVKPQIPYSSTSPVSSNSPRPSDPSDGRCFKCNELGHIKANCPKNAIRVQFITPPSPKRSPGPDTLGAKRNFESGRKGYCVERHGGTSVSYPPILRRPQIHQPKGPSDNLPLHVTS